MFLAPMIGRRGGGRAGNKCIYESIAAVSLDMMPDERMQKEAN